MMNNVSFILSCFLTLFFVDSALAVSPKIMCMMDSWSIYRDKPMSYNPENIPAKLCDVIIYGYLFMNGDTWELQSNDNEADYIRDGIRKIRDLKIISPGTKVIFAVNGSGRLYHDVMASSTNRSAFATKARSLLLKCGFDGLQLYWFYIEREDKENFPLLLKEIHSEFSPYNLSVYTGIAINNYYIDLGYNVPEISKYLTGFLVTTYDMVSQNTAENGSALRRRSVHAPGSDQYYRNVEFILESLVSRGAPKEKLIFGLPSYGHTYVLQDISSNGLGSPVAGRGELRGNYSKEPGTLFYHEICAYIQSGKWIRKRDPESGIPYAYNPATRDWVSYDDQETIAAKARFAKSSGYGGICLWTVATDDFRGLCGEKHGLLRTLARELKGNNTKEN